MYTHLFKVLLSTEVIWPFRTCFLLICLFSKVNTRIKLFNHVMHQARGLKSKEHTSIVVVFADTSEMCMIKKPITLKANARFKTAVMKMKDGCEYVMSLAEKMYQR